jgi:hypothetical protein
MHLYGLLEHWTASHKVSTYTRIQTKTSVPPQTFRPFKTGPLYGLKTPITKYPVTRRHIPQTADLKYTDAKALQPTRTPLYEFLILDVVLPGTPQARATTHRQCGPIPLQLAADSRPLQILTAGTANCTPVIMVRAAMW